MQSVHTHFDALISHGGGATASFNNSFSPSSRLIYLGTSSKPSKLRFVRAAGGGASVEDGVVKPYAGDLTLYEILEIPESGTLQEIKQAYKRMARKYHPDVSPAGRVEEHTRRFIRVQEAYETLSDSVRRAVYDTDLAGGFHRFGEEMEYKREWSGRWQSQLSELKRRSKYKDAEGYSNSSWGARIRRHQKDESSAADSYSTT